MKSIIFMLLALMSMTVVMAELSYNGCVIDGKLVDSGEKDPNDICMVCDISRSKYEYSPYTSNTNYHDEYLDIPMSSKLSDQCATQFLCKNGEHVGYDNRKEGTRCGEVNGCKMSMCDGKGGCFDANVAEGGNCKIDRGDYIEKTGNHEECYYSSVTPCYNNTGACNGQGECVAFESEPFPDGTVCREMGSCTNEMVCMDGRCMEGRTPLPCIDIECHVYTGCNECCFFTNGIFFDRCDYEALDHTPCNGGKNSCVHGQCRGTGTVFFY